MRLPILNKQTAALFVITWPIFIELFLHIATGSIDVFMLSRVSDEAVAAVGVANQILYMCIILFGFVSMGTTVVVAQYVGAQKHADASQVAAISITLNLFFGLLVGTSLVLFDTWILSLFRLDESLLAYGEVYLNIVGGALFFEALLLTASAAIRSYGFTRDVMLVILGINVLNIIGNYLLIFGSFGFPELGVTGAALSTAVCRFIGLVVMFILLYKRLPERIRSTDYWRIRLHNLRNILRVGIPAGGEHLSWQTSQMVIIGFITLLGTTALTTHIYTFQLLLFIMLFGIAVGQGTEIIIGQMIGAGKKEEAYHRMFDSLKWSLVITLLMVILFVAFRHQLYDLFTDDRQIIATGAMLLLITIILEPGRTFNLVIINSLRAAGDTKFPVFIGILSMWGISVPLAYLFGITLEFGLLGIYMAFVIDEWLRGILMFFRWKKRSWQQLSLESAD
jgi:putative MATE family efflux protein